MSEMYCPITRIPAKHCTCIGCGAQLEKPEPLKTRLLLGQVASCGCMVKTPDSKYHHPYCHTRLLQEAFEEIQRLEQPDLGSAQHGT